MRSKPFAQFHRFSSSPARTGKNATLSNRIGEGLEVRWGEVLIHSFTVSGFLLLETAVQSAQRGWA